MSGSELPKPGQLRRDAGHTSQRSALSPELEAAAARRLGAVALITAGAGLLLGGLEPLRLPSPTGNPRLRLVSAALSIALSLGIYVLVRSRRVAPRRVLGLAFFYEVAQGLVTSIGFYAFALAPGVAVRGWTSVAVWIVVFPLFVPAAPARVAMATLATAITDPLGLWINVAFGAPRPALDSLVPMFVPTVVACLISPLAARIVYGLTVEVKRAREMGSYRLVEKLGQGGMGEVWRAEHRMLARGAAIKLIRPAALGAGDGSRAREMVKRFEREAQATAALRSPHTIEVYDYGLTADGTFYYVMELLEGFSLQTLVEEFGPLPPERVVSLLRQACHSLAEAHAAGLVHRDVKPANMFLCRLGLDVDVVKVLDFGLVKLQHPKQRGAEALTVEGAFTGTPGFMPPEVALGDEPVDGRADIYALGCVAYWLLTGKRVFEGGSAMQMVIDHVRTPPVPPSQRGGRQVPDALERLIMRCLEKHAAMRPASVVELSRELGTLGLEEQWTEEKAREWWQAHQPEGEADADLPILDVDPSRDETQSQADPMLVRRA